MGRVIWRLADGFGRAVYRIDRAYQQARAVWHTFGEWFVG